MGSNLQSQIFLLDLIELVDGGEKVCFPEMIITIIIIFKILLKVNRTPRSTT